MTGERLVVALRRTPKKVKVIHGQRLVAELSPDQALELVLRNSTSWQGSGTRRRVSAIEFRAPLPKRLPWQACWLTLESSVFRFHEAA